MAESAINDEMVNETGTGDIVLYERPGEAGVEVRVEGDTIWLTQQQIADLFNTSRENITMHIRNILREGELHQEATSKEFLQVQIEGSRRVRRKRLHYNLDMIISLGYRVNSRQATQFRVWATDVLKRYLVSGYAVNQQKLNQLNLALSILERSATPEIAGVSGLVKEYTRALFLLEKYDEAALPAVKGTGDSWRLTAQPGSAPSGSRRPVSYSTVCLFCQTRPSHTHLLFDKIANLSIKDTAFCDRL